MILTTVIIFFSVKMSRLNVQMVLDAKAAKVAVYSSRICEQLPVGRTVIISKFTSKRTHLILNESSTVYRTGPIEVPESVKNAALEMINPPAPKPVAIEEAKRSPQKTLVSVQGRVTKVSAPVLSKIYYHVSLLITVSLQETLLSFYLVARFQEVMRVHSSLNTCKASMYYVSSEYVSLMLLSIINTYSLGNKC